MFIFLKIYLPHFNCKSLFEGLEDAASAIKESRMLEKHFVKYSTKQSEHSASTFLPLCVTVCQLVMHKCDSCDSPTVCVCLQQYCWHFKIGCATYFRHRKELTHLLLKMHGKAMYSSQHLQNLFCSTLIFIST